MGIADLKVIHPEDGVQPVLGIDLVESGTDLPVAPTGRTRIRRSSGVIETSVAGAAYSQLSALPTANYLASSFGILPTVADNGPPLTVALAYIRTSGRAGRIWFEPASYYFLTGIADLSAGLTGKMVELMGSGSGATYLLADGATLLATGTLLQPGRYFHCYDMTIGATAARSGGQLIAVTGDMEVADAVPLMDIQFGNVNMIKGFDGLLLQDNGSAKGVCGFSWEGRSFVTGFAANGTVFKLNTPNGTVNTINNVSHKEVAGAAGAARPLATMRILGAADLRCDNIESVYCQNGLVIDPGASGRAATLFMRNMVMGQVTGTGISIAPNATADCHSLQFVGGYVDLGGMSVNQYAKSLHVSSMVFFGNTSDAIKLDGTSGASFENILFSGNNAKCFHALNSAKNFTLSGAFRDVVAVNTVGVHLEAGTNKYDIGTVGNEYCTTPLTEPSPGASRRVSML